MLPSSMPPAVASLKVLPPFSSKFPSSNIFPYATDRLIHALFNGKQPIIFVLGDFDLIYAPIPVIKPPPPVGTNTASISYKLDYLI